MEDPLDLDGFDLLIDRLESSGSGRLNLPGLDEPARPQEYVRMILTGARAEGWDFDEAWAAAVNRLQPSQEGGVFDMDLAATLLEERALIEEDRPYWQANYEGRDPTSRERAYSVAASWRRIYGSPTVARRTRRRRVEDKAA